MKTKVIAALCLLLSSMGANAAQSCAKSKIISITTGPAYGALLQVADTACGKQGWVCLDPNGERMSVDVAKAVYSHALSNYVSGNEVSVSYYDDGNFTKACGGAAGGFPVIFDLRSYHQ
ncbi:hypothetical protein ONV78_26170 [Hahella sp. CR1]|uniref:hypothetical protein n=1 Tax=Hahella sp. CR1 TaxID=2992807 RepID=UPI00244111DE|nr:hypothetical protein [Hahella sp. CR1]MDG9671248.1 hypothetical protein [Hahella sp. CR1]